MDRRDQELLDKQLARFLPPPRRDGLMVLAVVGVFLAGMTAGSFLARPKFKQLRAMERWR